MVVKAVSGTAPPGAGTAAAADAPAPGAGPAGDSGLNVVAAAPADAPPLPPAPLAAPAAAGRRTYTFPRYCGRDWKPGATSSTTRYWFSCVNIVEICRCPNAS